MAALVSSFTAGCLRRVSSRSWTDFPRSSLTAETVDKITGFSFPVMLNFEVRKCVLLFGTGSFVF